MTLEELNTNLTKMLKNYLTSNNHVSSGALKNSIYFNSTLIDNNLKISLNSLEYINYLDNGDFLDNFFSTNDVLDIIGDFYSDVIIKKLD